MSAPIGSPTSLQERRTQQVSVAPEKRRRSPPPAGSRAMPLHVLVFHGHYARAGALLGRTNSCLRVSYVGQRGGKRIGVTSEIRSVGKPPAPPTTHGSASPAQTQSPVRQLDKRTYAPWLLRAEKMADPDSDLAYEKAFPRCWPRPSRSARRRSSPRDMTAGARYAAWRPRRRRRCGPTFCSLDGGQRHHVHYAGDISVIKEAAAAASCADRRGQQLLRSPTPRRRERPQRLRVAHVRLRQRTSLAEMEPPQISMRESE